VVRIRSGDRVFAEIDAIVFDKDGTLENSLQYLRELAYRRARQIDARIPGTGEPLLLANGIQDGRIDPAGLMAVGSRHDCLVAAAAYIAETGRRWHESRQIAAAAFAEADRVLPRTPDSSPLFPGVRETLAHLQQAGVTLAVLSADSPRGVEAFATRHELSTYFAHLAGVDDGRDSKPDPELLRAVCAAIAVPLQRTLMVGDAAVDIEMARRAEAAGAIAIAWEPSAVSLPEADVCISQLRDLQVDEAP